MSYQMNNYVLKFFFGYDIIFSEKTKGERHFPVSVAIKEMFCSKCGKELPDGSAFCDTCGAQIEIPKQEEVLANETTVEPLNNGFSVKETPAEEVTQPVAETQDFAEFTEENKPKKSKKKLFISLTALVLAACVAIVTIFNFSSIKGLWAEKFGSDEDYFKYVEKKSFSDFANSSSKLYGKLIDTVGKESFNSEAKVELQFGDSALDLIKYVVPSNDFTKNLDWLKTISYSIKTNISDKIQQANMKFNIGDGTLIDFDYIVDAEKGDLYAGLLNLSSKYLKTEMPGVAGSASNSNMALLRDVTKKMPSDKEYQELVEKYIGFVIDCIGNVEKSLTELTIGEYTQKVTVLEYKITEGDVLNIAKKVLTELKNDGDVKEFITGIESTVIEEYEEFIGDDYKKGDLYKEYQKAIQEAIDEISSEQGSEQELLAVKDYVNSSHEIIGREIEIDGETIFEYASAYDGDKFAYEAKCDELGLLITGEGTDKDDVLTATYSIKFDGQKLGDIKFENFDCTSIEEGLLNGNIELIPSYDIVSDALDLGIAEEGIISMLKPSIKFSFKNTSKSSHSEIEILSKGKKVIGLVITASQTKESKISIPKDSEVISFEDAEKYLDTLDLNKLVTALEKAKLPKDLLDKVKEVINSIEEYGLSEIYNAASDGIFSNDYEEDYDYEDDYEDYDFEDYDYEDYSDFEDYDLSEFDF